MKKIIFFCLILVALSLTLCACSEGQPQETGHQHSYVQGVCTGCQEKQADYKPLLGYAWVAAGLELEEVDLDVVSLCFYEWGNYIEVGFYGPLDSLDQASQDYYLNEEPDNLYEFDGKKYYHQGVGLERKMTYKEQGDTVEIRVEEGMTVGVFKMVRTAADQYTVTEASGTIINSTVTSWLKAGTVFTAE